MSIDARTIQKLLQCVQTDEERVTMTVSLEAFCEEHPTIGRRKGNWLYLSAADKATLRQLLQVGEGVDPATVPTAWQGKTRAEALLLGYDEKLTHSPVKRRRVAVKALRADGDVDLGQGAFRLPPRCHVDIDFDTVSVEVHDWLIVVENWECFLDVHVAAQRLEFPGQSPLVVWRGDTSETRADGMMSWLARLTMPVAAFVDLDPAGLVIAATLPRLDCIVAPAESELRDLLRQGLRERFMSQLPACQRTLDECAHPTIRSLWRTLRNSGRALPQEHFIKPISVQADDLP